MEKKNVICDTDVLIDYWDTSKKRHSETKKILENQIGIDNIVLSAITQMELITGASNKSELHKLNEKLQRFNIVLINETITLKSVNLIEKYRLSHGLAIPDGIIAATAIIAKLELFTYNIKDFKFISGIRLFLY